MVSLELLGASMCTICLRMKPEEAELSVLMKSLEFLGLINSPIIFCLSQFWLGVSATPKVLASSVAGWLLQGSTETRFRVQDVY